MEVIVRAAFIIFALILFTAYSSYLFPMIPKFQNLYRHNGYYVIRNTIIDNVFFCIYNLEYINNVTLRSWYPATIELKSYKVLCKGHYLNISYLNYSYSLLLPDYVYCNFYWVSGYQNFNLSCTRNINNSTIYIRLIK